MGYIKHEAVVATLSFGDGQALSVWRNGLPADWQALCVGPVKTLVNLYETWAWLPDGSKEGWGDSDEGDGYRQQFIGLVKAAAGYYIHVAYGPDHETENDGPTIVAEAVDTIDGEIVPMRRELIAGTNKYTNVATVADLTPMVWEAFDLFYLETWAPETTGEYTDDVLELIACFDGIPLSDGTELVFGLDSDEDYDDLPKDLIAAIAERMALWPRPRSGSTKSTARPPVNIINSEG